MAVGRLASALCALCLGACTLDARTLVREADLEVLASEPPPGAARVALSAKDSRGHAEARSAPLRGASVTVTIYVSGLDLGPAQVRTEAVTASGERVTCREDGVILGEQRARLAVSMLASGVESEEACSDGLDNDCDGEVDCADAGCLQARRLCAVDECVGEQRCLPGGWSSCSASSTAEQSHESCRDGIDNDCDEATDCADADCNCFAECDC
jgi:hypothetical protein